MYPVATKTSYSNLGFIVLGEIIQKISNRTIQDYYKQHSVFMGLKDTDFNPSKSEVYNIAPTEYDACNIIKLSRN
jgi:CubicO group peptidase (beta-lactamase class C family)